MSLTEDIKNALDRLTAEGVTMDNHTTENFARKLADCLPMKKEFATSNLESKEFSVFGAREHAAKSLEESDDKYVTYERHVSEWTRSEI